MKIIALDSSGNTAAAAILDEERLIAEMNIDFQKTHSQTLLPMLDEICQKVQLDLKSVDAVAVAGGPGSFTGLRIGSATAKGIGFALKIPVINVPTLKGMAWNFWGSDALVCPMIDARRQQVYAGIYHFDNADMTAVLEQGAFSVSELIQKLNELGQKVILLGDGASVYEDLFKEKLKIPYVCAPAGLNRQRAASIAACGMYMLKNGQVESAAEHKPEYLRVSQAEREREERLKAGI